MLSVSTNSRAWMLELTNSCQRLAGCYLDDPSPEIVSAVASWDCYIPRGAGPLESCTGRLLLLQSLAHLVDSWQLAEVPEIAGSFLTLVAAGDETTWISRWHALTARCSSILRERQDIPDYRVRWILEHVEQEFREPHLTLRAVATRTGLSASRAGRLIKAHTGAGFLRHLHHQRVAVARRLLLETPLSVKEVSSAVGYQHPSQLCRHFKAVVGKTPRGFRRCAVEPGTGLRARAGSVKN